MGQARIEVIGTAGNPAFPFADHVFVSDDACYSLFGLAMVAKSELIAKGYQHPITITQITINYNLPANHC